MGERSLIVRLGAELSDFEKATGKAAKSLGKFGKELTGLGASLSAAITLPLVGLGTAAVAASQEVDGAMNLIRTGTGSTGAELDALGSVFTKVFEDADDSATDVATAITELHKRSGLGGDALGEMANQMMDLSAVSKTELTPLIGSTTKAFANWGVETKDQSAVLDNLWKVSQKTGVGVGTLADQLSEGGSTFRALGVPMEAAAAMLGRFQKAGVDSGAMMAGLSKAAKTFSESGGDVAAKFNSVLEAIRQAPNDTAAAAIAIDTFGKSGVAMADAIRKGTMDVSALMAELAASPETIAGAKEATQTLAERFDVLKNKVTLALAPLGKVITDVLIQMMPMFSSVAGAVGSVVGAFASLPQSVRTSIVVMGGIAAAVGPVLVAVGGLIVGLSSVVSSALALKAAVGPALVGVSAAFTAAGGVLSTAWAGVTGGLGTVAAAAGPAGLAIAGAGRAFLAFATGPVGLAALALTALVMNWDRVKSATSAAASAIGAAFGPVWTSVKEAAGSAWKWLSEGVASAGRASLDAIGAFVQRILAAARGMSSGFWSAVSGAFSSTYDFAAGIWDSIVKGVSVAVDSASKLLQGLLDVASRIGNWVVEKAQMIASKVKSLMPGGSAGGSGGPVGPAEMAGGGLGASAPGAGGAGPGGRITVPALAAGGLVSTPTLAMIGEAGPEAVIPLSKLDAMMAGGGGGGVTVILQVSGSIATEGKIAERLRDRLLATKRRTGALGLS